nr:uncharacterized protein LOC126056748 [Helicoverpa armigera]
MSESSNVTVRRGRVHSMSDIDDSFADQTLEGTTYSIPDLSDDDDDLVTKLKKNIHDLTIQLNSANGKIDSLSLEIDKLKKENENLILKNSLNEQITSTPIQSPTTSPKKRRKKTPKQAECVNKQTQTDIDLNKKDDEQKITASQSTTKMAPQPAKEQNILQNRKINRDKLRNKLCILSTNKTNKNILTLANEYFTENYQICHYLTPNVGIIHLLRNIETQLQDYTKKDFCVIMIGEEDFQSTECYFDIITLMRNKLQNLKNTNIIIALPTFKFNDNYNILYNSRLETFNNMLYLDNFTHQYSYILDSNLNLSYHPSAYTRSGALKDSTMEIIFEDLYNLQLEIIEENELNKINEPKEQFFLQ